MTTSRPTRRPPVQTIGVEGRTLAYRHHVPPGGSIGTPVVLIHGFGGDHLSWGRTAEHLASTGHDTYALDLPGHGLSGPDIGDASSAYVAGRVQEAVDRLDLGRVRLVGHSLGGLVAMQTALRVPQTIDAVALIAPAGIHPRPGSSFLRAFVEAADEATLAQVMADLVAPPTRIPRAVIRHVWAWKRREGVSENLARLVRGAFVDDGGLILPGAELAASAIPTLVMWGTRDAVIPVPDAVDLPAHARVEMFAGLGHSPHLEDPALVLPLLTTFLSEAASSSAPDRPSPAP